MHFILLEISQGFHKTVKNDLVIRHIPGETGPSYGYFTLEPGMVKRACRISWNLVGYYPSTSDCISFNSKLTPAFLFDYSTYMLSPVQFKLCREMNAKRW